MVWAVSAEHKRLGRSRYMLVTKWACVLMALGWWCQRGYVARAMVIKRVAKWVVH